MPPASRQVGERGEAYIAMIFSISRPMRTLQDIAEGTLRTAAKTFYRPELDSLRFFAFMAVLLHHGPAVGRLWGLCAAAGGFGLSMFFLLSAYLITELLLREREATGTVAWRLFFVRRALRIWPLYYAALAGAILIALVPPHKFWIAPWGAVFMSLFVANWFRVSSQLGVLVVHLWSISVEEQFYLIWPPIIKFGGATLASVASLACVALSGVWLWVFCGKGWALWYDTPVEFLFFAAGAVIALLTRRRASQRLSAVSRAILLLAGLSSLAIAARFGRIGTDFVSGITRSELYLGYGAAVAGCVLIFLAILGMSNIPSPLIYLGKISYGLYVFHLAAIHLAALLTRPFRLTFWRGSPSDPRG